MPIFEYVCQNCGYKFEKLILSHRSQTSPQCPQCGAQNVKKAISVFGATAGATGGSGMGSADVGCSPSG